MAHPLEQFGRVFLINLATRVDRLAEMAQQLESVGLSLKWPHLTVVSAIRPEHPGEFPTSGAYGCFMSHLGVLREADRMKLPRIVIWEDDLDFAEGFLSALESIRPMLDSEPWSMFYGTYCAPEGIQVGEGPLTRIEPSTPLQRTQFVAYQGDTIAAVADYLEKMLSRHAGDPAGGPMHVDGALNWFRREHPARVVLLASRQLGFERASRTDVHELAWYDRLPWVREVTGWLRKFKRRRRW